MSNILTDKGNSQATESENVDDKGLDSNSKHDLSVTGTDEQKSTDNHLVSTSEHSHGQDGYMIDVSEAQLTSGHLALVSDDGDIQSILIMASSKEGLRSLNEAGLSDKCVQMTDGDHMYLLNIADGVDASDLLQGAISQTSHRKNKSHDPNDITQSWFTSRSNKQMMMEKGVHWRQGLWQREEIDLLQENIAKYCREKEVATPGDIIFNMTKEERKDFYRTISHGLQRPLFSVYRRVIRNYDPKNYVGKYSSEDMRRLRELHNEHGNDWATIGSKIGRSASSVKDKCRLMKDLNGGKWLVAEENRLAEAVYLQTGAKPGDEVVTRGLSWSAVADFVRTRTAKQCRSKWLNYLNWKEKGGSEWSREADIALILKIMELKISHESDIDWELLASNWSSARSPQWLRGKWWSLKRHVPDYQNHTLEGILKYLKENHIETLRVKEGLTDVTAADDTYNLSIVPLDVGDGESSTYALTSSINHKTDPLMDRDSGVQLTYLVSQLGETPVISLQTDAFLGDQVVIQPLSQLQTACTKTDENIRLTPFEEVQTITVDNSPSDLRLRDDGSCISKMIVDDMVLPLGQGSSEIAMVTTANEAYSSNHSVLMSDPMMVSNSSEPRDDKR